MGNDLSLRPFTSPHRRRHSSRVKLVKSDKRLSPIRIADRRREATQRRRRTGRGRCHNIWAKSGELDVVIAWWLVHNIYEDMYRHAGKGEG